MKEFLQNNPVLVGCIFSALAIFMIFIRKFWMRVDESHDKENYYYKYLKRKNAVSYWIILIGCLLLALLFFL